MSAQSEKPVYAPDDPDGKINAFVETDVGTVIRLREYEPEDGRYAETVEIVDGDTVVTVHEQIDSGSFRATAIYNHMIQPFMDEDGDD